MRGKTTGNLKERGKIEGEQMAASPEILWKGDREGRKVRAPQGRVVRNTDCFCEKPISQGAVRITDHPALWSSDFPPLLISLPQDFWRSGHLFPFDFPPFLRFLKTSKNL